MDSDSAPKISVIVPAYNAQAFIEATIASVLAQTEAAFEVIVIDDGSTDDTLARVRTILDPRVRVEGFPNAGCGASRNRGLALARGRYVAFLDADDLWTEEKLGAQLDVLERDPEAAVVYSFTDYIDGAGAPLGPGSHARHEGDVLDAILTGNFVASGSNPLIRREAFEETGGFDETLANGEDWDMWIRLAACFKFRCVPDVHVLYRIHSSSKSGKVYRMERHMRRILQKAEVACPEAFDRVGPVAWANAYAYLLLKGLEQRGAWGKLRAAIRFGMRYVWHDPALIPHLPGLLARAARSPATEGSALQRLKAAYRQYRRSRLGGPAPGAREAGPPSAPA